MGFYENMRESVDNGARLMDVAKPGWYVDINTDNLDMSLMTDCIIGQSFIHGYATTMAALSSEGDVEGSAFQVSHGFSLPMDDMDRTNWDYLRDLWINEIDMRILRDVPVSDASL